MARSLKVPRRYEEGFVKIRDLSEGSTQELLDALDQLPATYNEGSLSQAVANAVDTIPASDVEEIVPALLSIYSYLDYSRAAISEVAEGVAQDIRDKEFEDSVEALERRSSFVDRLSQLLSADSLKMAVRAGVLALQNERPLQEARVLTDIRPIFEPDQPEEPPAGAVIIHTLKVSYWADNDTRDIFVALDTGDVEKLAEQLERAKSKAGSLRSVLKAAQIPYIDSE